MHAQVTIKYLSGKQNDTNAAAQSKSNAVVHHDSRSFRNANSCALHRQLDLYFVGPNIELFNSALCISRTFGPISSFCHFQFLAQTMYALSFPRNCFASFNCFLAIATWKKITSIRLHEAPHQVYEINKSQREIDVLPFVCEKSYKSLQALLTNVSSQWQNLISFSSV